MKTLLYTTIVTGILILLIAISMIWVEPSSFVTKLFVTLGIILVGEVIAYLVMRDVHEEGTGKDNGTIAR